MEWLKRLLSTIRLGLHFFRVGFQVMYGAWKITRLPQPVVSIFGGHLLSKESIFIEQAHKIASILVEHKISVITGGGQGIMEAANSGAAHQRDKRIRSMGIGVAGLPGEKWLNRYVKESIILDYFFARKYLLTEYSMGFVIFPGGLGTMDELSDLMNLVETKKRSPAPVILFGKEHWTLYIDWIEHATKEGLIEESGAKKSLILTDDVDHAIAVLVAYCAECVKD
ncbi:MAG: TIGR00730 family Rossman fold protein [Candidatus Babeliaceae bacterium]